MVRCLYNILFIIFFTLLVGVELNAQQKVKLESDSLKLGWTKINNNWELSSVVLNGNGKNYVLHNLSGMHTLIYTPRFSYDSSFEITNLEGDTVIFPEPQYRYLLDDWAAIKKAAFRSQSGNIIDFYPTQLSSSVSGELIFKKQLSEATLSSTWKIDPKFPNDICVKMCLTAKQSGYFSMASPMLFTIPENQLAWGAIPGQFQGNSIESDFVKSFVYGQGIPNRPILSRERTVSTLAPLLSNKSGVTISVIPEPGISRDPWYTARKNQMKWNLGFTLMNRQHKLSPTLYYPVLGEESSYLNVGDSLEFNFRYTLQAADWFTVLKHAALDIYKFNDFLHLKKATQSLTNRVLAMHQYALNDSTSKWRTIKTDSFTIGAQDYLGGVYEANSDAMKNSDYGAMWMMANLTGDPILKEQRLPLARNFKLAQQHRKPNFLFGATAGQYFLWKSKRFTEEWGPYTEPIAITYYMMMDIGNMLLFNPDDEALKEALQIAANKLLSWMKPTGEWAVAYDENTGKELFTDLSDLRPTFYGLMVAYDVLGDKKYLDAACTGANWFIENAVNKGSFLGVCGDARFVPDFATGQSAQALLDLYEITQNEIYLNAAVRVAEIYTTSIYTHPIPSLQPKIVKGVERADWEIAQAGLSFEHGGTVGSANTNGPILLASHAGMFVRFYALTKDSIFLSMARAAIWGRHAFVDSATNVASYYWSAMNNGPGAFPHHAWWQIGLLMDYLMAEINMRSSNQISFPSGFLTPKVGPHKTYGFKSGNVYGTKAQLCLKPGLVQVDNPQVDYVCAVNEDEKKLYIILLNNSVTAQELRLRINHSKLNLGSLFSVNAFNDLGEMEDFNLNDKLLISPTGIKTIELGFDHIDTNDLIAATQGASSPLSFTIKSKKSILKLSSFKNPREFVVRNGLPFFIKKANSKEPVVIGFIGGSITQANYGYRLQTADLVQSLFPGTPMHGINAGISGTGADLGACRIKEQLLNFKPDLIFIEFAVNGAFGKGVEGMVRQIKKYAPATDICFIYALNNGQTKVYAKGQIPEHVLKLELIADHYGLPSVHMGLEAALLEKEGRLVWKGNPENSNGKIIFSADGIHPLEVGGNLYAFAIARALNFMKEKNSGKPVSFPEPFYADNWEDAKMLDPFTVATYIGDWEKLKTAESTTLNRFSHWFPYLMKAEKPEAAFHFSFEGNGFGVFDIGGPEVGQLEIEVDGEPVRLINRFNAYCNNRYRGQFELIEVPQGIHTVTIKLSDKKANKAHILGLNKQQDIIQHPEKYDQTVFYLGKLLIRGNIIK